jgi:hypothetical protein
VGVVGVPGLSARALWADFRPIIKSVLGFRQFSLRAGCPAAKLHRSNLSQIRC